MEYQNYDANLFNIETKHSLNTNSTGFNNITEFTNCQNNTPLKEIFKQQKKFDKAQ